GPPRVSGDLMATQALTLHIADFLPGAPESTVATLRVEGGVPGVRETPEGVTITAGTRFRVAFQRRARPPAAPVSEVVITTACVAPCVPGYRRCLADRMCYPT